MTISLRGEEHEVHVQDHGYDPETNSHDVDWYFESEVPGGPFTEAEWEAVDQAIRERLAEPHYYDELD